MRSDIEVGRAYRREGTSYLNVRAGDVQVTITITPAGRVITFITRPDWDSDARSWRVDNYAGPDFTQTTYRAGPRRLEDSPDA
jgi:hypothetical protein